MHLAYTAKRPHRNRVETSHTGRRMVNDATQREIIGNVWINDFQKLKNSKNSKENNEITDYTKKSTFDQQRNAKRSINIEDDTWLEEFDNVLKEEDSEPKNFKFTITNFDHKNYGSKESSIVTLNEKYDERESFSSLNSQKMHKYRNNKVLEIDISDELSDL